MALFSTLSELVNKLQTLAVLMALFSKNITKFHGRLTNCQPWQFWWHKFTVTQTADLGSFNGTFQQGGTFGQQTADLGSFNGTFQQRSNVSIKLPTSGSFNGAKLKLQTLAVSMALFGKVTLLVNKLLNLAVLKSTVPCRQDFVRGQILVQDGKQLESLQRLGQSKMIKTHFWFNLLYILTP